MSNTRKYLVTIERTFTYSTTVSAANFKEAGERAAMFEIDKATDYEDTAKISKSGPVVYVVAVQDDDSGSWRPISIRDQAELE